MNKEIHHLLDIMSRLRNPEGGCPWDLEQNFATIAPYTIEEAYEVAEAIAKGDKTELRDELGDLLLQVVFHSQMAAEEGSFTFEDVVKSICEKMIRRHPHVFSDAEIKDAEAQTTNWEVIKEQERKAKKSERVLADVPTALPALMRAQKLQARAARVGFDWPEVSGVIAKVKVELAEVEVALIACEAARNPTSPFRGEVDALASGGGSLSAQKITPTRPAGDLPPRGGGKFRPALISVMLANNETGVIQPIADIARIAHAHGALVHTDAVQALGKIPLDWGLLGVDMLTLCAHKAGGPVGAGALLIRNDLPIKPLITGGGQELSRRAGTENLHAIVGFAQMVHEVANCAEAAQWLEWRKWLTQELMRAAPGAVVCGAGAERLPNTLNITMPGVKSETQIMNLDLAGFAVSAGSACSSGRVAASSTLLAMGLAPEIATCALRISWGWGTTRSEIEQFATAWKALYARLSNKAA